MEAQSNRNTEETNNQTDFTVDVIIPTYHSDDKLDRLLKMLYQQTIKPRQVFLLHTEDFKGQEQPIPEISKSNISIIPIDKKEFDHGATRGYGASLSNADILMFMTQDAIPADERLIESLLIPFEDPWVAAAYARQLPDDKANLVERYTRHFNYPKLSRIKSKDDIEELGIKTFFCSDVCAAYRNSVYQKMGGFVKKTIFNEDMIMAAGMIRADYRIAYAAEAKVIHSHKYTYLQQFTRNFDLGVSHNQYKEVFQGVKSESEGMKLVKCTLRYLIEKKQYLLVPDLILSSGFKYLGYQFGLRYDILPKNFVMRCSMNKAYWK